ncbi:glutamate carboxypeptidase 2-like [Actinia tenebrosa]|uniref:glutamate carboxypeptidase II n=1 Tax=Actinia tenebrosa TaxID=6105 RepID=A0A6P8I5A5_ACTTE|nr:glutamate carboxypeptidase 2-like [Actinia tenebrosa]
MADTRYELTEDNKSPRPVWKTRAILALKILLVVVVFFIGFVIGYFVMKGSIPKDRAESSSNTAAADYNEYATRLAESLQAKNIEEFSKYFTKHPHMGGTTQNDKLAYYIRDKWLSYEFNVDLVRYDVLLSMPRKDKPNAVKVINTTNNDVLVNIEGPEKTKEASENDSSVASPFLAYSPPGDVSGDLVYVNYGRVEDFVELEALGQNCSGKIAIMRYGKIFRGNKVANAESYGAKGAILFSDPADYAPGGVDNTFPKSWWLPETGSQRGSILGINGDPLTPDLPSKEGIYRIPRNKAKGIPGIPAQPMGYGDAIKLLSIMTGPEAPAAWRGGLAITYRLGPGFKDSNVTLRLIVNNQFVVRPTYNVIGTINGREEPDRVVLLGNHRDAWVFGGVDPSSGTAVMMELSRGVGELMKTSWRPRRTIMFCSWGAEEYGLIGSWEWVEENQKWLGDRAVTYINLDSAVSGNYSFSSSGNALLTGLIMEQAKKATDQNQGVSLYEAWKKRIPGEGGMPRFGSLGSGSDYSHFAHFLGVPSIDIRYVFRSMNVSGYPVYHSVHDTFYWQKTFTDPYFKSHLTVSQIAARILVAASDSPLLPFTLAPYSATLLSGFKNLKKNEGAQLQLHNITLDHLEEAINIFKNATDVFESKIKEMKVSKDFAKIRALNDQVMLLERTFIWPYGLPGRSDVRHVIFAPSLHNQYGSSTFPGIGDVLFDIVKTGNWQEVKRQISIITYSIRAASKAVGWMY